MRDILRKRFPGRRVSRILGWTAAAVTWGAVGMAAGLAASKDAATTASEPPNQPPPTTSTTSVTVVSTFPQEPTGGLVILRGIPSPEPEPVTVVRRVVVTTGGGSSIAAVAPAPAMQTSSGS